jgi:hypothetical protein
MARAVQNLLFKTIIVSFVLLLSYFNNPAYAYMKSMLQEKLTVSNEKIRLKASRKLIVKPRAGSSEVRVFVRGEVDESIKEIFLNGVKAELSQNQFEIEYPVREILHESRIYAHDDPKNPNYAVMQFHIPKLQKIIEYSTNFFLEMKKQLPQELLSSKKLVEYYLEFRMVKKSNFYEPFLVISVNNSTQKKWSGNYIETYQKENSILKLVWALDESVMNLKLSEKFMFKNVAVKTLYPGEALPWEMTKIEQELGPPMPEQLYPKQKVKVLGPDKNEIQKATP